MRMLSPISTEITYPRRTLTSVGVRDVFEDFDVLVDSFLRPTHAMTANFQPSCDVKELKNHYLVSFDLPGVKKEDIKIEVRGRELVISGERHRDIARGDAEATLRVERTYGNFERIFTLPEIIDANKIEAHHDNGVLHLVLAKTVAAQGRTIQIQTSPEGILGKLLDWKKDTAKDIVKEMKKS